MVRYKNRLEINETFTECGVSEGMAGPPCNNSTSPTKCFSSRVGFEAFIRRGLAISCCRRCYLSPHRAKDYLGAKSVPSGRVSAISIRRKVPATCGNIQATANGNGRATSLNDGRVNIINSGVSAVAIHG
jgi:hypothetical protein